VVAVRDVTLKAYGRWVDVYDYPTKRRDLPHDIALLLELARDLERQDEIIVDAEYNGE